MDANTISNLNQFYSTQEGSLQFIIDSEEENVSYAVCSTQAGINDVVNPGSLVIKTENGEKTLEWMMFNRSAADTINNITDTGHAVDDPNGFYLATAGFEERVYNLCNKANNYNNPGSLDYVGG